MLKQLGPGLWRSAACGAGGLVAAGVLGVSAIPVTLLSGALVPQKFIPSSANAGLKFASTHVLRAGIVCIGFKLSLIELASISVVGIPCVLATLTAGSVLIPKIGKAFGLDPRLTSLITIGSSVCGVTAITALAPAIKAREDEVAIAVSNVVLFGTAGMICFPHVAHAFLAPGQQSGIFLGLSVHDTSQVMGAAASHAQLFNDNGVLEAAAVTKLTRNLSLAAMVPWLSMKSANDQQDVGKKNGFSVANVVKNVPGFVVLFVAASVCRSAGDVLLVDVEMWKSLCWLIGAEAPKYLLGIAMGAVGLAIKPSTLVKHGWRPFVVGASAAGVVALAGFLSSYTIGQFL